jgi:putative flippase GtrA
MTVLITNQRERNRFLRFSVVGIIGAVVDFGLANLLTRAFHVPLVIAGAVSFVAAILSNFTWNRFWTYPDSRSKPITRQLVQFGVISVMGLAIRIPLLYFLEPVMENLAANLGLGSPSWTPKPEAIISPGNCGDNRNVLEFLCKPVLDLRRRQ